MAPSDPKMRLARGCDLGAVPQGRVRDRLPLSRLRAGQQLLSGTPVLPHSQHRVLLTGRMMVPPREPGMRVGVTGGDDFVLLPPR
jgi:hypothetical protein